MSMMDSIHQDFLSIKRIEMFSRQSFCFGRVRNRALESSPLAEKECIYSQQPDDVLYCYVYVQHVRFV